MWVPSLGQEDPLEKEMATHSSILPGKSHGQRSLAVYSPWAHKSQTQLSDKRTTRLVSRQNLSELCELDSQLVYCGSLQLPAGTSAMSKVTDLSRKNVLESQENKHQSVLAHQLMTFVRLSQGLHQVP